MQTIKGCPVYSIVNLRSVTHDDFSVEDPVPQDGRVAEDRPRQVVAVAREAHRTARYVGAVRVTWNCQGLGEGRFSYFLAQFLCASTRLTPVLQRPNEFTPSKQKFHFSSVHAMSRRIHSHVSFMTTDAPPKKLHL